MKTIIAILALTMFSVFSTRAAEPAEILVLGDIYTVDSVRSWAKAMAVSKGRIVFVGTSNEAEAYRGKDTKIITLEPGQMVMPGIQDSHVHLLDGGMDALKCDLLELKTPEQVIEKLKAHISAHPEEPWLLAAGWAPPLYPDGNPNKADLDKILPDKPAYLVSQDGHSGWVNSAALKLAGIDKHTPDPPRGRIERDPKTGEPTGTLRELAMNLIEDIVPKPPDAVWEQTLRDVQKKANSLGITSIQDAYIIPRTLKIYHALANRGELTVRVQCALYADAGKSDSQVEEFIAFREKYTVGDMLRVSSVKFFADGGMEGHTAALIEAYTDRPHDHGEVYWPLDRLTTLGGLLDKAGFQLHIHMIGDKAAQVGLDAIAAIRKANGFKDTRPQFAHLELVAPADIARFRELEVIANFSPLWSYSDSWIEESTLPVLGPERTGRLYAMQSFFNAGAVVSAGSDWPVSSLNPFEAMQVGITRQPIADPSAPAWIPSERVTLPEILAAYTINGAYANHLERISGSLEAGKNADFIILDRNLFGTPVHEIGKTRVLRTFLDGKEVYRTP
ncbi:MAG TPA: amidohydrolase [Chthoniobacteraceae bacterium]|nr:amidohydrolase [Chthoniobacteraceae bacterium]